MKINAIDINGNLKEYDTILTYHNDEYNKDICFATFISELNSFISTSDNSFNLFSVDGIIKSFIYQCVTQ